jgi:hypothetical protein
MCAGWRVKTSYPRRNASASYYPRRPRPNCPPPEESTNSLRQGIRVDIFGVAASWLLLAKRWKKYQPWTKRIRLDGSLSAAEEEIQRLADGYLSLYLDLAVLEERSLGNLPAFESIRIVKERKREEAVEGA